MTPIRTILHPTDYSECSEYALRMAAALARDHAARLLVLHVAVPREVAFGSVVSVPSEADVGQLAELLSRLKAMGFQTAVEQQISAGAPALEILRVAREKQCDLIVMGTHGRTGLRRVLLGSVAAEVMRQAPCPVLTVKVPSAELSAPAAIEAERAPDPMIYLTKKDPARATTTSDR